MHICIVYDCLFPYTVGGAERWYRALADELVAAGHEVTYLTRRQWASGESPAVPGVRVIAVSRDEPLYDAAGRRRTGPPIRFGLGVLRHLAANRRRYDAVHCGAFPFFSLLAARAALVGRRAPIGVDWFEVWSLAYWREYLGPVGGRIGHAVQRLCVRLTDRAYVFSQLHARRLGDEGLRSDPVVLSGLFAGPREPIAEGSPSPAPREPLAVFAGRHIPEKRAELIPGAIALARRRVPGLRGLVLGDGPRRPAVLQAIADADAGDFVTAPGFVDAEEVAAALERATCMVLPSSREGYGLVVIEAAAHGTPSIVVAGEDNAAAELVRDGVNGFVAASASGLAEAIVAAHEAGEELRRSTREWFAGHGSNLTAGRSAARILELLERP
jgi:glycosyltransferase involved in cell wall biosynthesis